MAKKPKDRKKGVPMPADQEEKNAANGELREGANVDKIRDILFGSNMREYEKRFARLEERLTKSSDALREDLKKRFDTLETFVREEMESLSQRRAERVVWQLAQLGLPDARLHAKGVATGEPIRKEDSEENRQYNRSVTFRVSSSGAN